MADTAGFDEFYQGSRQRLLGYVFLLTGDLAEAQDVVQEAYMRAWQRWSTIHRYAGEPPGHAGAGRIRAVVESRPAQIVIG